MQVASAMFHELPHLATVGMLALAAAAPAQGLPPGFDEYVEAARVKWQVPALSIAVVKDGEVVLVRGYGPRQIGKDEPVGGQTVFRLASISKTFTAATAALRSASAACLALLSARLESR